MAGRKTQGGGVRGPNSALTEFLRNEGITDAFRQRRVAETQLNHTSTSVSRTATPDQVDEGNISVTRSNRRKKRKVEVVDEEEAEIIKAGKRKRKIARKARRLPADSDGSSSGDDDDNDSEIDYDDEYEDDLDNADLKKSGDIDTCVECNEKFHLNVYSRFIKQKNGYLCDNCHELLKIQEKKLKRNQLAARKTRKKVALALLDKTTVKIPSLQDICIKKITHHITDVEVLGDIGQMNFNKISKILSKNRSLNDDTISLFLTPDSKKLEFWDCSNVSSDALNKIAAFCPNLESLTLFMCGQLHNDNMKYFQTNLPNLHELSLNGAFLISSAVWQEYFETSVKKLTKFELRNTHRFDNDSLISLLENSGKTLTSLKLSRLDGIDSEEVYGLIPHYLKPSSLTHLELSFPQATNLITDDLLINILAITGDSLLSLNLDGCSHLTDRFLIEGLAVFCPNLTHLSLKHLYNLSNDGFSQAFESFAKVNNGNLTSVDLTKCVGLADEAVYSLLHTSSNSLIELNLNSIDKITKDFLLQICTDDLHPSKIAALRRIEENEETTELYYEHIKLPLLTTCDMGFVRAVDDEILSQFSHLCPKLSILEVYGDNRCTSRANYRDGLLVIGRQNDEI